MMRKLDYLGVGFILGYLLVATIVILDPTHIDTTKPGYKVTPNGVSEVFCMSKKLETYSAILNEETGLIHLEVKCLEDRP